MHKKSRAVSFYQSGWVKAALLLLSALLLLLLDRRRKETNQDDQPVIWRRDIEMGPTEGEEQRIQLVEEAAAEERAPEAAAGLGLTAEQEELQEQAGGATRQGVQVDLEAERAEVVGPIPLPEDEDDEVEMQTPAGDDLSIVEGIGPKINSVLHEAGIRTFSQLSEATPERLEEILRGQGLRLANPETWPEQARLAATGDWNKLENYQKKLKGGRKN